MQYLVCTNVILSQTEAFCKTWSGHQWSAGILSHAFTALQWETIEGVCLGCQCAFLFPFFFVRVPRYTDWDDTPQCKLSNCYRDCIRLLWDTNVETRGRSDRKINLCQDNVYLNAWALKCIDRCSEHSRIHQAFFLAQQKILGNLNV